MILTVSVSELKSAVSHAGVTVDIRLILALYQDIAFKPNVIIDGLRSPLQGNPMSWIVISKPVWPIMGVKAFDNILALVSNSKLCLEIYTWHVQSVRQ
jgi:hypothetical protein